MKRIFTILLLLPNCLLSLAQDIKERTFFQTNSKIHLYYVDISHEEAKVYSMGRYLDKAGTGYSIRNTDTLIQQPDGSYVGKNIKITRENNTLYLVTELKKTKRLPLDIVTHLNVIYHNLNNAYFLDRYVEMSNELNKTYPLNHHTFRIGLSLGKNSKTQL